MSNVGQLLAGFLAYNDVEGRMPPVHSAAPLSCLLAAASARSRRAHFASFRERTADTIGRMACSRQYFRKEVPRGGKALPGQPNVSHILVFFLPAAAHAPMGAFAAGFCKIRLHSPANHMSVDMPPPVHAPGTFASLAATWDGHPMHPVLQLTKASGACPPKFHHRGVVVGPDNRISSV